jgi:sulfur-oxidizing protein SoxX
VKIKILLTLAACGIMAGGCATPISDTESDRLAFEALKSSFEAQGQAGVDRLNQDEVQAACSKYRNRPPPELAETIQKSQLAAIKYPDKLMGDWHAGERIAQSGRGMTFTDDPASPAGGNCYACHQLAPRELAFGTIGPSLSHYGKVRGAGEAMQRRTFGKIYNSNAYFACSGMPRFGHNHILTSEQIADVVDFLLNPESPVNQ